MAEEVGDADPIRALLQRALAGLVADAGADRSAGGALLAATALRWRGQCGWDPCSGLDRVRTMRAAARFHADVDELAAIWQVIALKEALDGLEVGRETVLYPRASVAIADALLGLGAGPLPVDLVRRARPDETVWGTLSRAAGRDGVSDWEGARVALGAMLATEARRAEGLTDDSEMGPVLDRIARRAVP